jgi:phosphoribosylanthranilate isomerase
LRGVHVKICGLSDAESVASAVDGGARYLGFVFCPVSRRAIDPKTAASLIERIPSRIASVGLFVDPQDDDLERVLSLAPLKMIQLHGSETPERVQAVKKRTGLHVIKAIGIAAPQDIAKAKQYEPVADILLLDAKPSSNGTSGGNGVVFDWSLLKNAVFSKPWILAGGLDAGNIEAAVAATGARILDVSSGVEYPMGRKSPAKIKAFLDKAATIETCC